MSGERYYVPKLEEFHQGFEYEVYVPEKGIWSKEIFHLNDSHIDLVKYVNIQDESTVRKIRVKHLHLQDMEEFNFHYDPNYTDLPELGFINEDTLESEDTQYLLFFDPLSHLVRIERIVNSSTSKDDYLFRGYLKNKTHLRDILKKLKILNED